jgi:hypothetical protein
MDPRKKAGTGRFEIWGCWAIGSGGRPVDGLLLLALRCLCRPFLPSQFSTGEPPRGGEDLPRENSLSRNSFLCEMIFREGVNCFLTKRTILSYFIKKKRELTDSELAENSYNAPMSL